MVDLELHARKWGRSFEENQEVFDSARKDGSWKVRKVNDGKFEGMPGKKESGDEW
jgi:hypothetical protein